MGEMRDMFFCALVYLFLFTVQSSQEKISATTTPFFDDKNASNSRKIITEVSRYAPRNVSIMYSSDNGDMQEGNGFINITCNADCNPECDRYLISYNGDSVSEEYRKKETRIKKDRINSGLYRCKAFNSLSNSVSDAVNISIHYATVILESNVKELAINISDILPRDVSCRIDCNFPGCDSEIVVKRNSRTYRKIQSRDSIFENRAAKNSDNGTYVCTAGKRMSENNFELIIYHGPITASVLRKNQIISVDIIEKEDNYRTIPLKCSSSCYPLCEVAWYKDGQLQHGDSPVIKIKRDRRMSGVYHCEASGVEGNVKSDPVHVIIQYNSLRKQGNESHEEDNASEIVENILYITADDAKEQIQAPETITENPQNGSDVYAVVEKKPKPDDGDDQPVYTDVCKADQKKKKPAIAAKPSKVQKDERPTVNKDGLIYVDLDLKDTPSTSKGAFVIHGADDRTQYVDIDFTRRADPPPDTDNEQTQNEKEKEKA